MWPYDLIVLNIILIYFCERTQEQIIQKGGVRENKHVYIV